jgi:ADP-heptose:LPS heptosyltransferase
VGVVWAGRPTHLRDRSRSISPELLEPLAGVPRIALISLQVGRRAEDLRSPIHDFTADLTDFEQTAGLIDQLDLVIAVDTAVAHLAGAMGKPVWVMLPFSPDWRWMLDRDDSPWYPSMRLFRQAEPGNWRGVIRRIADELR